MREKKREREARSGRENAFFLKSAACLQLRLLSRCCCCPAGATGHKACTSLPSVLHVTSLLVTGTLLAGIAHTAAGCIFQVWLTKRCRAKLCCLGLSLAAVHTCCRHHAPQHEVHLPNLGGIRQSLPTNKFWTRRIPRRRTCWKV